MNDVKRYKQLIELTEDRDFWRGCAIRAMVIAGGLAFLLFCFGIGELILNT